jgi:signal transduction histidine kinase
VHHAPPAADDVATAGGEAERLRHERATLHALARALAAPTSRRDVVERALATMIAMRWCAHGAAWLREGEGPPVLVAASWPDDGRGGAPGPGGADVEAALARPTRRTRAGWRLIPIADAAVLGLHGGREVAPAFSVAIDDVVAAGLEHALLRQRLAEQEAQRSRLVRALLSAQEEERSRIARDLHDQIGQALTAMLITLDRGLERSEPTALGQLRELAALTLADVRRIALDLRPAMLDDLGLEPAVERYARELQERYGLVVDVCIRLPSRLSRPQETVLYRVVQESLTNVVRHARAGVVSVVAHADDGRVELVVDDDGGGFEPGALAPSEQLGLLGMRERVELLGGALRIESSRGAGCRVHVRLPLR